MLTGEIAKYQIQDRIRAAEQDRTSRSTRVDRARPRNPVVRRVGSGLLASVDLAIFSSRSELSARGATEAMWAGLPVVGTDVPGIVEAIGKHNQSFLSPPGDAAGLADATLRLARDRALRLRVGKANAQLLRGRQPPAVTSEMYVELLANALTGGKHETTLRPRRDKPHVAPARRS